MKKLSITVILLVLLVVLAGCKSEANVASENISKEADMFRVHRRITFINGITDKYLLVIEGKCSLGNFDAAGELSVTCKTGDGQYKKHFLGLSDNVIYISEQLDGISVDEYRYKLIFRPEEILPDIELDVQ